MFASEADAPGATLQCPQQAGQVRGIVAAFQVAAFAIGQVEIDL